MRCWGLSSYRLRTGERIGFGLMVVRELIGQWISAFFLFLGYLWILFNARHQGWHDKMVGSVVEDMETSDDFCGTSGRKVAILPFADICCLYQQIVAS
jgi:hypothetical protein